MEGHEIRPTRGDAVASKGKGKVVVSLGNTLSKEKPMSPPSLEVLMSDFLLFEESLLKDPDKEVLTSLCNVPKIAFLFYYFTL